MSSRDKYHEKMKMGVVVGGVILDRVVEKDSLRGDIWRVTNENMEGGNCPGSENSTYNTPRQKHPCVLWL